jgi:hypothetical protein
MMPFTPWLQGEQLSALKSHWSWAASLDEAAPLESTVDLRLQSRLEVLWLLLWLSCLIGVKLDTLKLIYICSLEQCHGA